MPVKRLGTVATKAERISQAVSSELANFEKQLERPIDRNRGSYERVMVESIRPDPQNPRHLALTWEELQQTVASLEQGRDVPDARRAEVIESIRAMAANFKAIGQLQSISVYRDERGMLRIIDGERRYWAARLVGLTELDARVRASKPDYLRLEQYSANVFREGLTLGEQLGNLEMILTEAADLGNPIHTIDELTALWGRSRSVTGRWWALVRAPEDVKAAIRQGHITSLERAYVAAQEPDAGRRAVLIAGHAMPEEEKPKPAPLVRKRVGRPPQVNLGRAKDLSIVRLLIEAVPVATKFDSINWDDTRAVQNAWKKFIKELQASSDQRMNGRK